MPSDDPQLIFVRKLVAPDDSRQLHARRALRGAEHRVAHGVYLADGDWQEADARARAIVDTRRKPGVLSHWTAAAVHDLPIVGAWPGSTHLTMGTSAGGRSKGEVVKHSIHLDERDVVAVGGLRVTSVARTIVDMAAVASFADAVIMADGALRLDRFGREKPLTTARELADAWAGRLPFRGHVRARAVIAFADGRADTPIESLSRVTMRQIGCPAPRLQTAFFDADGFIGGADFEWPEFDVIGEADGDRKYLDAAFRSGRSVERVLLDEKNREDRLRALPKNVVRWNWKVAADPRALETRLRHAGIRW
jgi:hypothetical protein